MLLEWKISMTQILLLLQKEKKFNIMHRGSPSRLGLILLQYSLTIENIEYHQPCSYQRDKKEKTC